MSERKEEEKEEEVIEPPLKKRKLLIEKKEEKVKKKAKKKTPLIIRRIYDPILEAACSEYLKNDVEIRKSKSIDKKLSWEGESV